VPAKKIVKKAKKKAVKKIIKKKQKAKKKKSIFTRSSRIAYFLQKIAAI